MSIAGLKKYGNLDLPEKGPDGRQAEPQTTRDTNPRSGQGIQSSKKYLMAGVVVFALAAIATILTRAVKK